MQTLNVLLGGLGPLGVDERAVLVRNVHGALGRKPLLLVGLERAAALVQGRRVRDDAVLLVVRPLLERVDKILSHGGGLLLAGRAHVARLVVRIPPETALLGRHVVVAHLAEDRLARRALGPLDHNPPRRRLEELDILQVEAERARAAELDLHLRLNGVPLVIRGTEVQHYLDKGIVVTLGALVLDAKHVCGRARPDGRLGRTLRLSGKVEVGVVPLGGGHLLSRLAGGLGPRADDARSHPGEGALEVVDVRLARMNVGLGLSDLRGDHGHHHVHKLWHATEDRPVGAVHHQDERKEALHAQLAQHLPRLENERHDHRRALALQPNLMVRVRLGVRVAEDARAAGTADAIVREAHELRRDEAPRLEHLAKGGARNVLHLLVLLGTGARALDEERLGVHVEERIPRLGIHVLALLGGLLVLEGRVGVAHALVGLVDDAGRPGVLGEQSLVRRHLLIRRDDRRVLLDRRDDHNGVG